MQSYQVEHHLKTRSEVIQEALSLLEQARLEASYREASKELDENFEVATFDGLENDTW